MFEQRNKTFNIKGEGICLINKKGYFLKVNDWLERILGYSQEELKRMMFNDVIFSEDSKTSKLLFSELLNGRVEQYQMYNRYIRKDGKIIQMKVTISGLGHREGFHNKFLCKYEDARIVQEVLVDEENGDAGDHQIENANPVLGYNSNQLNSKYTNGVQAPLAFKQKDIISEEVETRLKEQRRYFRVKLDAPLCADMKIIKKEGKNVQTAGTKVCVLDIGPGGLKFMSELWLPVDSQIVLEFSLCILKQDISLCGSIVHEEETQEGIFEYGVQFIINEQRRTQIARLLNDVSIKLKKNIMLHDTGFCKKENIVECLKSREQSK